MGEHISETVSAGQLRAFIERIERLEEEIKSLNSDKSEVYAEMRGVGFDVKAVRQCVAARKMDSAEREERNAIFDLYWEALTGSSRVHVHEGRGGNHSEANNSKASSAKSAEKEIDPSELTDTQEQPETANEIPVGSHDQHHELVEGPTGQLEKEPLANADAVASVSASHSPSPANAPRLAADDEAAQANPTSSATHSNPQPAASLGADTAGDVIPPSSPAALSDADVPAFLRPEQRKTVADYRQHCLNPDACGASGLTHCYTCRKAMEAASETEAV